MQDPNFLFKEESEMADMFSQEDMVAVFTHLLALADSPEFEPMRIQSMLHLKTIFMPTICCSSSINHGSILVISWICSLVMPALIA